MIKKKVVIVAIVSVSVLLNGMQSLHKKVKKEKSRKASQELTVPFEENNILNKNDSKKLSVKKLDDVNEMKRAQNAFRDKAVLSKSENSLDKK